MASRLFKYRGMVERWVGKGAKRSIVLKEGYSEDGEFGPCYPWMTKTECRDYARKFKSRAKFQRSKSLAKFRVSQEGSVEYEATKAGKCWCNKKWKLKRTFKRVANKSADVKTRSEIYRELLKEARTWEKEPVTCDNCK